MHEFLFKANYLWKRPGVRRNYNAFQESQWRSFGWLRDQQAEQLRKLVDFACRNVPYYTELFDQYSLKSADIATLRDLEKLPILTKKTIKENWQDFTPRNGGKLK